MLLRRSVARLDMVTMSLTMVISKSLRSSSSATRASTSTWSRDCTLCSLRFSSDNAREARAERMAPNSSSPSASLVR